MMSKHHVMMKLAKAPHLVTTLKLNISFSYRGRELEFSVIKWNLHCSEEKNIKIHNYLCTPSF